MKKYLLILAVLGLAGCENDTSEADAFRRRQDNALRDPMNYTVRDTENRDVSGGGLLDFKKDAFKRDVNSVFNP
jgi:hypothetical protein